MRFTNLCVIISTLFLLSCDPDDPRPVFCLIDSLQGSYTCTDSRDGGRDFDANLPELLLKYDALIATPFDDFAEMKKHYKKVKQDLDRCEGR